MSDSDGLGGLLRSWRDRTSPTDVELPAEKRRTPGLRREELASLASLSVDYVIRLEQGRATSPSADVVASLARALRLSGEETAVMYAAAGLVCPIAGIERAVPPTIRRVMGRLGNLPVAVYSADWWLLHWNATWSALLGDPEAATGRDRNLVWQVFDDQSWRATPCDRPLVDFQRALVADLRALIITHPGDVELRGLIDALRARRPIFAQLWEEGGAAQHRSERKKVAHPHLGDLVLDCDVMMVPGSEVRLLVYSAEPGSADAAQLDLLTEPGTHTFAS